MIINDSDREVIIREKFLRKEFSEDDLNYFLDTINSLKQYIIKVSENLHREQISYPLMVNKIINSENFSMTRIQDGEWTCMLKIEPHYTNKMSSKFKKYEIDKQSERLLEIIKSNPKYYISVNAGTFDQRSNFVWPLIKKIENLYVGEIFRRASVENSLTDFISALKKRKVIIVGPDWLKKMINHFDFEFVKTEFPGIYEETNVIKLERETEIIIEKCKEENPVILYSCGLMAKILIDKYYHKYGNTITQIDMGAVWDPYCGKITRPYHKKIIDKVHKK